jgi:glycosyltransferase
MKISVVTVCFNSEATIADTVRSFLEQTHSDKEMLIVDGRSTDRTLDIVRSFGSESIRVLCEPDSGIYDAMNKGLAAYRGDAVGFLNSDDTFHDSSVLERIAGALEGAEAAYGDLVFVTDHRDKRAVRTWTAGPYRSGAFRRGWMPPHPTFYVRRSLADAVGSFDLRYDMSADYDYMLRALAVHEPAVAYVPHTLIDFMQGGHSTKGLWRYVRGNYYSLRSRRERLGAPIIDLAMLLKPIRKAHQWLR